MSDQHEEYKFDLALREWRQMSLVSDRSDTDWLYYCDSINEFRLGKYLITFEQLVQYCNGQWALVDHERVDADRSWFVHGQIIGVQTEEEAGHRPNVVWRPGFWIVLNLGQVEIVPGANARKPASLEGDGIRD